MQDKLPPAMIQAIDDAVAFVRSKTKLQPRAGIVLGSGLGDVVSAIDTDAAIPYSEIPGGAASTVWGHSGKMIVGSTCVAKMNPILALFCTPSSPKTNFEPSPV